MSKRRYATVQSGDTKRRVLIVQRLGADGYIERWTASCSGCTPTVEESGSYHEIGDGCEECGYTGKRRQMHWEPLNEAEEAKFEAALHASPSTPKGDGE